MKWLKIVIVKVAEFGNPSTKNIDRQRFFIMCSQENAFKKSKNPSAFFFFRKTISLNNSFSLNWRQFQVFKIAKFEFNVKVHYTEVKCIISDP